MFGILHLLRIREPIVTFTSFFMNNFFIHFTCWRRSRRIFFHTWEAKIFCSYICSMILHTYTCHHSCSCYVCPLSQIRSWFIRMMVALLFCVFIVIGGLTQGNCRSVSVVIKNGKMVRKFTHDSWEIPIQLGLCSH